MGLTIRFYEDFPDIARIYPKKYFDERGCFSVTFEENEFKEKIGDYKFVQRNTSKSKAGVIRGLHYQINHPQGKLIHISRGVAIDFVVDIRKSSKNFGKWKKFALNNDDAYLWIPPGYAHGFYSVLNNTIFNYACTDIYSPEDERTILYCDTDLNIRWPETSKHILSEKDLAGRNFKDAEVYE